MAKKKQALNSADHVKVDLKLELTPGEMVRVLREICEWTQSELAEKTGIPQTTISAIENNRQNLGVERTKVFARVFDVHPAVILFSDWKRDAA